MTCAGYEAQDIFKEKNEWSQGGVQGTAQAR